MDLPVPGNYRRCVVPHLTQGTWTTNITRLPTSRGWHAMVYTKMAEYNFERSSFLLIHRAEDDLYKLHYRFLDKRISLPIHHSWARWLWKRAIDCEEAVRLEAHGIAAFWCNPDEDELRLDLAAAVSSGELEITE